MAGKASSCLAACPELQLPASSITYLDSVLSELSAEETEDYAALRTLLEPFLLDALKQNGRETPHNSTSDTKVEILCQLLYNHLRKETNNSQRRLGETPHISAALRKAAASVSDRLQLSTNLPLKLGPQWKNVVSVMEPAGLLHAAEISDLAIRAVAANKRYVATCAEDCTARLYDWKGTLVHTFQTAQKTRNVALSDKYLATGEKNGQGELFDLSKRNHASTFQFPGKVTMTMYNVAITAEHVLLSSCRGFGVKTNGEDRKLHVANLYKLDGSLLHTLDHGSLVGRAGICLNETKAATSGEDKVVKVWELSSGQLLHIIPAEKERSPGVRFLDGQLLLSGASNVAIYDLKMGKLERQLEVPRVERGTLRATPQTYPRLAAGGNYVVSASEDRHASVWTFSDGRLLCTISDERRISGDFYAAVCNERLALICGKSLKIYDLSVHAGYKRAVSEGLGVSLRFLIDPAQFSQIAQEAAGKENPNFHELAPVIAYGPTALGSGSVCPRDGRPGCALVDVVPSGPATHFLSWAWSYQLQTVVLALRHWGEDTGNEVNSDQTFIWICFFCNNQERILNEKSKEGSDDLETTFQSRLRSIGHVLVLFDNWSKPFYLTRVWCIFETFVAAKSDISYTLIFPPDSAESMHGALQRGMHMEVTKDWSSIDVAHATASRPVDEEKVKGMISRTSSFDEVNSVVKDHLVNWFKKQFQAVFEQGVRDGPGPPQLRTSCEASKAELAQALEERDAEIVRLTAACASKDEELTQVRKVLEERDAEIVRLTALLPAGSAARAAKSDLLDAGASEVDSLAISLAAMTWAELSVDGKPCDHTMAEILAPSLQEAFHECGDWPASEDMERARLMAAALLEQLRDDD
ncbi:WD repeat-containing protein 5-like [Symbiodinium microadriaticum]|uniref:WD repeat-containing protein 5-like n=1 Tax=Symbiodinium microadriaticum TaxID=2951 RepID=A0A1Q9DPV9_SYMMI|nr:WD repeat-containing protein 5-like [Symbiodinium microadriaticum]CAE7889487.1 wdr5 [Symbiodinium sp. KB8]